MTKKQKFEILASIAYMSDEELKKKTIDKIWGSLGDDTERMYNLGYDREDIIEQQKYQKWKGEECDLYCYASQMRGIDLFETEEQNDK